MEDPALSDNTTLRRLVRLRWWQRHRAANETYKSARSRDFELNLAKMKKAHPGLASQPLRRLLADAKAVARNLAAAFAGYDAAQRRQVEGAFARFFAHLHDRAADPAYTPEGQDWVLSDFVGQFQEHVAPNLSEYYLCRRTSCRYVFRNVDWINNVRAGGGHYMCAMCAKRYKPWECPKGSDAIMPANKVYIYPADQDRRTNLLGPGNRWSYTLIDWQDSVESELTNRLKAVFEDLSAQLHGLSYVAQYEVILRALSTRTAHAVFTPLTLPPYVAETVRLANLSAKSQWDHSHLDNGFYGCQLPECTKAMAPLSQKAFLDTMAQTFWLAHRAGQLADLHGAEAAGAPAAPAASSLYVEV